MPSTSIPPIGLDSSRKPTTPKTESSSDIAKAAQEFECLFVTEMLRRTREESGGSWMGGETSAGSDAVMEFAEQHMAKAISQKGAFGISRMIQESLLKKSSE